MAASTGAIADGVAGPDPPEPRRPAIELIGIDKRFGAGPRQPRHPPRRSRRGTIHGIVGENGAGKSTLMSILYGFYQADSGEIRVNGKPSRIPDSQAAIAAGIGMVHQHFMLVENFTVLENVMLGAEGGAAARRGARQARARELKRLEHEYEPRGRSRRASSASSRSACSSASKS